MEIREGSFLTYRTPPRILSSLLPHMLQVYPSFCSVRVNSCCLVSSAYPAGAVVSRRTKVYGRIAPSWPNLPVSAIFMAASPFSSVTRAPITAPVSLLVSSNTALDRGVPFWSVLFIRTARGAGRLTMANAASSASVVSCVM